ncbi:hypothetical protein [Clostridium sporogenes]|uniref:hypothetical protein n=1 Tax=Clostridium sporogenes TaxID=1509 RepID=UPI0006B27639|nr:hypothetical protein [Clostridium sporogenes]
MIGKEKHEKLINLGKELIEEYKDYTDDWHCDVCIRRDGSIYYTSPINYGNSMEVFNGEAIVIFTVNNITNIEDIKQQIKQRKINIPQNFITI